MSETNFRKAFIAERKTFVDDMLKHPKLRTRILTGNLDSTSIDNDNQILSEAKAREIYLEKLTEISQEVKIREAAHGYDEELKRVKPGKPKLCQCWWMELDDSPINQWVFQTASDFNGNAEDEEILNQIKAWLPFLE